MGGFVAKLADFGTSLPMPTRQLLTESVGTSGYTAPEVMTGEGYDLSADVFSLGVLQWETLQPFDQKQTNPLCGKDPQDTAEDISEGVRPSLEHCLVPAARDLIERCWATDSDQRPTASEVHAAYEQLVVAGQEAE
jgi:serine/threonine protein kinase